MKRLIPLTLLLLAACGTASPKVITETVEVAVPITRTCFVDPGPEPLYADREEALAAAPNIFEAMKLRIIGRGQRIDRDREVMAALAVCKGSPTP